MEKIKMDTNRRRQAKLSFPEPEELKNNYTKFAETPDFEKKKSRKYFLTFNMYKIFLQLFIWYRFDTGPVIQVKNLAIIAMG
jgi:hypothetical protein